MPSDDLVLNVRQIENYPPAGSALPSDALLLQRGGLGGPYLSLGAAAIVATALATDGGPALQVGIAAPVDADPSQIFVRATVGPFAGWRGWNVYSQSTGLARLASGPGALFDADPIAGWTFEWAPPGAAGSPIQAPGIDTFTTALGVSPTGYLTVGEQVLLARDPATGLEAATAQWVSANTVRSFNMRMGDVMLNLDDIVCAGGAPNWSPFLSGSPRATTPPPWSNSTRIATTAFVVNALKGGEVFDSPQLTGIPTAPTAPVGTNTDQIATTAFVMGAQFAPIADAQLTGIPTAPTADPGTSTGQIATTAFVTNAIIAGTTGVSSFNTRTGAVVLTTADISGAGGATLNSPTFAGTPTAPTAAPGTANTQIATTAFISAAIGAAGYAPLANPAFTGVPTAPTANPGTNTQQLATTAFVAAAVLGGAGVTSFMSRTGAITLTANDISAAGGASLNSPAFFGNPTAPTPAPGDNDTSIATTAFVVSALAAGGGVLSFNGRAGAVTLTSADVSAAGGPYLPLSGGTLTGTLTIPTTPPTPTSYNLELNGAAATNRAIVGATNGLARWRILMGSAAAESGGNVGSDFSIARYDDTGAQLSGAAPLAINRATGAVAIVGDPSGSNAPAGCVGEFFSSINPGASATTAFTQNSTSILLPPGDWDIGGEFVFLASVANAISALFCWISPVSGSQPSGVSLNMSRSVIQSVVNGLTTVMPLATCRASVAVNTQYYTSFLVNFSSGTVTVSSKLWARRAR